MQREGHLRAALASWRALYRAGRQADALAAVNREIKDLARWLQLDLHHG